MQHIAKQHRVKALVPDRKMTAVVGQVIDACGGAVGNVQPDDSCPEHALQVMCDETVSAAHVQNVSAWRQHSRDFERHIVCATNFSASAHSPEATFDGCAWSCHR